MDYGHDHLNNNFIIAQHLKTPFYEYLLVRYGFIVSGEQAHFHIKK
jgi:hypothetical protein